MKLTWLVAFACFFLVEKGRAQSLTMEMSGLGTTEEASRVLDGVKIIYPADQDDLIELLIPDLKKYRETRQKNAELEAAAIAMAYQGFGDKLRNRTRTVLGIPSVSDDFDEALEIAIANFGLITRQWRLWSEDVSEIHFWNHATMKPLQTSENGMTLTEFSDSRFFHREGGESSLNFRMPFFRLIGTGVERIDLSATEISRHQLDLPIFSKPGLTAEESAKEMRALLQVISDLHQTTLIETVSSDIGLKYVQEYLLRHEIDASFFKGNPRSSVLINGLSRIHLYALFEEQNKAKPKGWVLNSFHFPIPEDPEEANVFLDGLTEIDPLGPVEEKYQEAAARIFAASIFNTFVEKKTRGMPFVILKNNGTPTPIDGFTDETFLAGWRKVFPDFDDRLRRSQDELIALQRKSIDSGEEKKQAGGTVAEETQLPGNYTSKKIGDYTFTFPESLGEAVEILGGEWAEKLPKAQKALRDRFAETQVDPTAFSESDLEALRSYGLEVHEAEAEMWGQQTATLANAGSIVAHAFSGQTIQVWLKSDAIQFLKAGGKIPNFELEDDGEKLTFNFQFEVRQSEVEGEWTEGYLKAIRKRAIQLPLVFKDGELGKKSVDDQVAALREADFLIGNLIEETDKIDPALLGVSSRWLSEEQCYFFIVHELVEADLVRRHIGSADRRWFCDGMANVIAIRQCERRFGKGEGLKTFRSLFNQDNMRKLAGQVDLLAWHAAELDDTMAARAEGVDAAHYFFATEALLAVTAGRDDQFIVDWLEKIRETRWVRTNAETVIRAFNEISGDGDLRKIVESITTPTGDSKETGE